MRQYWLIWLVVTVLISLYVWAGAAASRSESVSITIEPGYSAQVSVFRLAEDQLRMHLKFLGDHQRRPELGNSSTRSNPRKTGILQFDSPGAAVRIVATAPGATPVTYEAMPKNGHGSGTVFRDLTASLSIAPGVWHWPRAESGLMLQPGATTVGIKVVAAAAPLVGEVVELFIDPPLGFKRTMSNVAWLWPSFLWPILLAIQLLWAAVMGVLHWKNRRRSL